MLAKPSPRNYASTAHPSLSTTSIVSGNTSTWSSNHSSREPSAFFLVLPALDATSGACAPTLATLEVVFCMVSRLNWKPGEGLSTGCRVTRSIFVWIVIAYLSLPMVRVMRCSAVWIGAGRGFWKRSIFATLGIVRQRVHICKCPQSR